MKDDEIKDLLLSPSFGWTQNIVKPLLEELIALRAEKKQLVGELLAVTNCGFCSLCKERHGVK